MIQPIFIGDSDMSRWPKHLYPSLINNNNEEDCTSKVLPVINHSQSGALLQDIVGQVQSARIELLEKRETKESTWIFIACAGENDISCGNPVEFVIDSLDRLASEIFCNLNQKEEQFLIFLGPKLEPWLQQDAHSWKKYSKLSRSLRRACDRNNKLYSNKGTSCNNLKDAITFIDCLTMFCGDSAKIPGAVTAQRCEPQIMYFHDDGLHLSDEGYNIWKSVIEKYLLNT